MNFLLLIGVCFFLENEEKSGGVGQKDKYEVNKTKYENKILYLSKNK